MGQRTQLVVELDAESDPVQGTIGPEREGGTPFSGYVQLIAAVEAYRDSGEVAAAESSQSGYRGEREPAAT